MEAINIQLSDVERKLSERGILEWRLANALAMNEAMEKRIEELEAEVAEFRGAESLNSASDNGPE